jgi:histone H4
MAPRSTGGKIAPIQKKNDHSDGAKGVGSGRSGLKRHGRRAMLDGSSALSRPALRRLARRAGVKRINAGIYEEAPTAMRAWLGKVIADAAVYTEHARRMTVTINDVLLSLKRNGV